MTNKIRRGSIGRESMRTNLVVPGVPGDRPVRPDRPVLPLCRKRVRTIKVTIVTRLYWHKESNISWSLFNSSVCSCVLTNFLSLDN